MNAGQAVALRIFTGPHAGAELELKAGTWLLGSDPACDIVLQDSSVAARHARLCIEAPLALKSDGAAGPKASPVLYMRGAEGEVLTQGQPWPPDTPWPSGSLCFLGLTALAWAMPEEKGQAWRSALSALTPLWEPPPAKVGAGAAEEAAPSPASSAPSVASANVVGAAAQPEQKSWHRLAQWRRPTLYILLALLLAALCLRVGHRLEHTPLSAAEVLLLLEKEGFSGLSVQAAGEDRQTLRIRGRLDNDALRGRLVRLMQGLRQPLRLEVTVASDFPSALTAAFESRDIHPEVRVEEGKDGARLHIAAYIKDGIIENWAFAGAREDLPLLADWDTKISRRILYAADVHRALQPALERAGLGTLQVNYLPGLVEVSGSLDVEQRQNLDKAVDAAKRELRIPLSVKVREKAPTLTPEPVADSAAPQTQKRTGTFKVAGVTLHPLRFVTLASGERVFEGGVLPGGYTLENISLESLTLRRGSQTSQYPLRGTHEQ